MIKGSWGCRNKAAAKQKTTAVLQSYLDAGLRCRGGSLAAHNGILVIEPTAEEQSWLRKAKLFRFVVPCVAVPVVTANTEEWRGSVWIQQTIGSYCHQDLTALSRGSRESIRTMLSFIHNVYFKNNHCYCEMPFTMQLLPSLYLKWTDWVSLGIKQLIFSNEFTAHVRKCI